MVARIAKAKAAATDAGRDPEALMLTTACPPIIGRTDADYRTALNEGSEAFGVPRDEIEERFTSRGLLVGTPSQFGETIAGWKEVGVTRFYMQRITAGRSLDEAGELIDLIAEAAA
jgi:alkanesulfonate monooxygenase SsuD/methylene tetrahydromethanopterin reductase-like flavin-dependent oxidoreductase (luciferase family)